jgi:hypothetical protein
MGSWSAIRAIALALVCGGIASLLVASVIGARAANFDIVVVVGVDSVTIGGAVQILLHLFTNEERSIRSIGAHPARRSLKKSDAHELKIALVQHLSREEPVIIGFPANDSEAHGFAQQIATFLDFNGFRIAGFAAEPPPVPFAQGVGIDGNQVMVGPVKEAAAL